MDALTVREWKPTDNSRMPFKARPTPGAHIRIRCFFFLSEKCLFLKKRTEDAEVGLREFC